jgi:transposase
MTETTTTTTTTATLTKSTSTVGIDLGDRKSHICVLDEAGQIIEEGTVATTAAGFRKRFERCEPSRIAIEAGGQSGWVNDLLSELAHDVIVANPRKLRMIYQNESKCDRLDAEQLARVARLDIKLLHPIQHRERCRRVDLAKLRSRDTLVSTRTALVNYVRGVLKSFGSRVGSTSAASFHRWVKDQIPEELRDALQPILTTLTTVAEQIALLEKEIDRLATEDYPVTALLRQVDRVGLHTSIRFVLTVEDPAKIEDSRDAGAYFGLCPRRQQSGARDPELRITKTGDREMRRHLVQCAQQMLGRFGQDSDLRRWGLALAERGGKSAKKKAIVAVARKLAVLLHTLWRTGEVYEPLRMAERNAKQPASAQAPAAATPTEPVLA